MGFNLFGSPEDFGPDSEFYKKGVADTGMTPQDVADYEAWAKVNGRGTGPGLWARENKRGVYAPGGPGTQNDRLRLTSAQVDEYLALKNKGLAPHTIDEWAQQKRLGIFAPDGGASVGYVQPKSPALAAQDAEADAAKKALDAFVNEMRQPFNPNDPRYARILQNVAVESRKGMGGLQGSAATYGTQRALADASVGIQGQRDQLAVQAMQIGIQSEAQAAALREKQYEYDTGLSAATARDAWDWNTTQTKGKYAALGGVMGTVVGAYFNQPKLGATVGSSLAGGLANSGPPPSASYSAPSRGLYSGGAGGARNTGGLQGGM